MEYDKFIIMMYHFWVKSLLTDEVDNPEEVLENWIKNPEKWYCLCCGVEISEEQFCYSHGLCGYCDTGACQTAPFVFKEGHGKFLKLLKGGLK